MNAEEQKKFAILVGLAFLIIVLLWIATWGWQSQQQQQTEQSSIRSFFQNTASRTQPGIDSLKHTTGIIFKRNKSTDK